MAKLSAAIMDATTKTSHNTCHDGANDLLPIAGAIVVEMVSIDSGERRWGTRCGSASEFETRL